MIETARPRLRASRSVAALGTCHREIEEGKRRLEAFTDGVIVIVITITVLLPERTIIARNGRNSKLADSVGSELKGKLSLLIYAAAMPLAFVQPWIAISLYVAIALMWFVSDRRIKSII